MKLSDGQKSMLVACYEFNRAWLTAVNSPNHELLVAFEANGLFEEIIPTPHPPLVAYQMTDAGRAALEAS